MEKGVWIKYDGKNQPDMEVQVRVRFPDGWVSAEDDWDTASGWSWGYGDDPDLISHFMVKPD